jgi:peptidoglycan/LPS O-acetylase OafA/YrhL
MTFIGRRSYGIYLYHFPIFYTVNSFRTVPTRSNFITFSLAVFTATLIVACLSFWLEEPLMRWGRAWLDGKLRPHTGSTAQPGAGGASSPRVDG